MDFGKAVTLGNQPRHSCPYLVELFGHHLKAGLRLGGIEAHQEIAGVYPRAILHLDLGDNPAGRMLNLLDVGLNDEIAGNHDGARQRHKDEPAADQYGRNNENAKPGAQFVLERPSDPRRHALTLPVDRRGRIAAVQEEADARRQTGAAPFDHLSDTRFRLVARGDAASGGARSIG